jgi:hypothetical protein
MYRGGNMIAEKRTVGTALLFMLLTVATLWAAVLRQDPKFQTKEQPTLVAEGTLTEAQKKHGRLFQDSGRKKLSSLPDGTTIYTPAEPPDLPSQNENNDQMKRQVFQAMACDADLVIVGKPVRKTTQITEFGDYIFTDYEIIAEDVIRDTSTAVPTGSTVTITRPGGSVILNAKRYQVVHGSFSRLEEGKTYLLFLKLNTDSSTYQPASNHGTFLVDGNGVSLAHEGRPYWLDGTEDSTLFISSIRSIGSRCVPGGAK